MRNLSSKGLSGPEAVLCAVISWWLSGFDLRSVVYLALESAVPVEMWSRRPEDLARALPGVPWDVINSHFWDSASAIPAVRHMVESSVRAWRPRNGASRVDVARAFVVKEILREAGTEVLSSGWLEAHSDEIAEARRIRRRKT